jgi:hypothetical protein
MIADRAVSTAVFVTVRLFGWLALLVSTTACAVPKLVTWLGDLQRR